MRRSIQWLRQVAPPAPVVGCAILFTIVCMTLYLVCGWRFEAWDMTRQFLAPRDAAAAFVAAAMGVWRVMGKHPVFDAVYCNWLALTPWNRNKPLPLGPIALVPQDAIFVGLLLLLVAYRPVGPGALIPAMFLAGYLATLAVAMLCTNQRLTVFAIGFGLGLAILCGWWSPWIAVACLVATYLMAWRGLWQSLVEFPWRDAAGETPRVKNLLNRSGTNDWPRDMGLSEMPFLWPYNLLHHKRKERAVAPSDALAAALLMGWWAYALFAPFIDREPAGWMAYMFIAMICWFSRTLTYLVGYASPISLWGRLRTGRWIIWAYDQALVVPALIPAVAAGLPLALLWLGIPGGIAIGCSTAAIVLLTLAGPPRLRHWQLTAPARLTPWPRQRQLVAET